jgi:uncharacterized linocin/CFP29 family protein
MPDNADYVAALEAVRRAAARVAEEAESTIYMGRMECSVEAINVLKSALTAARYHPDQSERTYG